MELRRHYRAIEYYRTASGFEVDFIAYLEGRLNRSDQSNQTDQENSNRLRRLFAYYDTNHIIFY